jgi:hypothetical protein
MCQDLKVLTEICHKHGWALALYPAPVADVLYFNRNLPVSNWEQASGDTFGGETISEAACATISEALKAKRRRRMDKNPNEPIGYCTSCLLASSDGDYGEIPCCDANANDFPDDYEQGEGCGKDTECPAWKPVADARWCNKHEHWFWELPLAGCKECDKEYCETEALKETKNGNI